MATRLTSLTHATRATAISTGSRELSERCGAVVLDPP